MCADKRTEEEADDGGEGGAGLVAARVGLGIGI